MIVSKEGKRTYCDARSNIEGPMVPFGSTCIDEGDGLVFNQKATRFFLFLFFENDSLIEICF